VAAAVRRALWWCQRAAAWWRRRRADQRSAKARRAGLPAAGGHRRVAEGNYQVSVVHVIVVVSAAVAGISGEPDVAAQGVADGGLAEPGQGGQRGVPAGAFPGAGLGLVPAQHVLPGPERFLVVPGSTVELGGWSSSRLTQGAAGSSLRDGTQPRVQARAYSADR
jgi:hypothetical protein